MYFIYVLYSKVANRFYTGYTKNIDKRLKHHNLGLNRWSRRGIPWELVYSEDYKTKKEALRRERFLKTGKGREELSARIAKVVTARV